MLSSPLKNKIISTYAANGDNIELEARFGTFKGKRFIPGVNRQVFNRIKDYFSERATVIEQKTTDYIMGRVRKTIVNPTNNKDDEGTIWMMKERLWNQPDKNYNIRYSMSKEIIIEPIPDKDFVPDIIREKNRSSFLVFGNAVRVDITLVDMISGGSAKSPTSKTTDDIKYEVEVELMDKTKLTAFEKAVIVTLRLILDTIVLYNEKERREIVDYTNHILQSKRRGTVDHYPMVQARNLKLKDMVFGGLIGNEKTGYSATHKADGQRKLLVFYRSGIWLIMAPNFVNRVSDKTIPKLNGTILDGEMLVKRKRRAGAPESKIWYLAFDALAWNGDNSIQSKPHGQRMQFAQTVADVLKNNLITVNTKSFKNFGTPQEFFKIMREMFREQPLLAYEQDGFMFQPQNTKYNPHSDKFPLYKRNLVDHPDICKWKPKEQLTIDFQIKWKVDPSSRIGRKIQLFANKKGKPVLFKGTQIFPFTDDMVDHEHPLTRNLPNNTIVEYGWDYEVGRLFPHVVRHNKTKPNKIDIVEDIWMDIHQPLTQKTLEGDTLTLLRRYHNRIKKGLFNSVKGKKTLLDIGSGKGADTMKWRNFDKIVAVEPNPEYIEELKRRLESVGMTDKVLILQVGGEETEKIYNAVREFIGGRVDVVSMMLSLTFFWQNSGLVDSLTNTLLTNLKSDGQYIFLTMDGDLVEQTFEPAFETGPDLTRLDLGDAKLTYFPDKRPKELHIDIKDSIVQDQTEWLVRLDDLRVRMSNYGFNFPDLGLQKASTEKFLTESEIILTQMYTYGTLIRVDDSQALPGLEDIKKPKITYSPRSVHVLSPTAELPALELPPLPKMEGYKIPIETFSEEIIKVSSPPLPPLILPSITVPIEVEETELPAIPLNTHQDVNVSWYPDERVVRIGNVVDESSFLHGVLNTYLKVYQISDENSRKDLVKRLRRDISERLKENYDTYDNGKFPALYDQQKMGIEFKDMFDDVLDFSQEGLQKILNSIRYLPSELFGYISDVLGINVYIMKLDREDLYLTSNTYQEGRKNVVISGDGSHYETIGIERNGLFQTLFLPIDPFIQKIQQFR